MGEQKERARAKWAGSGEKSVEQVWFDLINKFGKTKFVGYEFNEASDAKILAIVSSKNEVIDSAKEGEKITIILDKTPFYGESGGQVGDTGSLIKPGRSIIIVENTNKVNDLYLHRCIVKSGSMCKGDTVAASIDKERRQTLRRNHSATHLLRFALRKILGDHVTQKGSLVAPDRLRFDFSHNTQVTQDQLFWVEDMVNSLIRENLSASTKIQSMNQAIDEGAMALFGEKYGDQVRVVSIGDSKELCGGTHVEHTGEIGLFKIVTESSVAFGVRRIEALTGQEAINYVRDNEINLKKVAEFVKAPVSEITSRLSALSQEHKKSETEIKNLYKKLVSAENIKSTEINGINFISHTFTDIPANVIREFVLQQQKPKTIIAFTATEKDKTVLIIKVSKDLINKISAKELISIAVKKNCGGNAELAQTGCDSNKIDDTITAIYSKITASKHSTSYRRGIS